MTENTNTVLDAGEIRELTLDEIDETSGAGLISWLKHLFGGDDPKPAPSPFNRPGDHLK